LPLPPARGFLYLAVVLDAWSRRIVGWAFSAWTIEGIVKANEYSRFSALNPAERGGNSRAKTVELQHAMVRGQAV
jgi:hypothetical protein